MHNLQQLPIPACSEANKLPRTSSRLDHDRQTDLGHNIQSLLVGGDKSLAAGHTGHAGGLRGGPRQGGSCLFATANAAPILLRIPCLAFIALRSIL